MSVSLFSRVLVFGSIALNSFVSEDSVHVVDAFFVFHNQFVDISMVCCSCSVVYVYWLFDVCFVLDCGGSGILSVY